MTNYTKMRNAPRERGFTLMELLIVLMILGLLAALVGPQLIGHVDPAKIKATKAQIKLFETGLVAFRLDIGAFPTAEEGLKALWVKPDDPKRAAKWRGPYMQGAQVENDAWENPYIYRSPGVLCGDYDIISYGSDGLEGGEEYAADLTNCN